MRASKYDDRIYFDTKNIKFIHLKWDHAVERVSKWWWTDYHGKYGYISGKLKVPKYWAELGKLPEGTLAELKRRK